MSKREIRESRYDQVKGVVEPVILMPLLIPAYDASHER